MQQLNSVVAFFCLFVISRLNHSLNFIELRHWSNMWRMTMANTVIKPNTHWNIYIWSIEIQIFHMACFNSSVYCIFITFFSFRNFRTRFLFFLVQVLPWIIQSHLLNNRDNKIKSDLYSASNPDSIHLCHWGDHIASKYNHFYPI